MSTHGGVVGRRRGVGRRPAAGTLEDLAARRFRVAVWLTLAMLAVYFAFILLIAFDKELLARRITDGLSLGILLGVVVVLATWVLTWIYVGWVNRRYEPGIRRLRR
jgi:uncharacterized membrane protein (DUF485 family)